MSAIISQVAVVDGLYLSEYDEIVKPHQRFLIPNYFIRYWVSRLGPTQAWIIVSLQQACWRAGQDQCTISQSSIAEEIGIRRRTVGRILREHPLRHWYIPEITYQRGVVADHTYFPLPNQYQVYLSTPLIPEHMAGLYAYLQRTCPEPSGTQIEDAIDHLLAMKSKEALALLEAYAAKTTQTFDKPLPVVQIVEMALGVSMKALDKAASTPLTKHLSRLHTHLTDIGFTACRQYFRLDWVPILGSTVAWLIMILRSQGYYNQETGETRDTYTWQKKDLAQQLGQSTRNLANLLESEHTGHFIQILDQQKRTLTVRVVMSEEPLTPEQAEAYWERQPPTGNAKKCPITSEENRKKCPITPDQTGKNVPSLADEDEKMSHHPDLNRKKCPPCIKYFKESIPHDLGQEEKDPALDKLWEAFLETIRLQITKGAFSAWFTGTRLIAQEGDTFTIAVRSEQAQEWLAHRLRQVICRVLANLTGRSGDEITILFVVD